ncbi:MAG TPA: hypothetical protein VG406_07230 [Isosphaeraceae bacterium]|nr:hypothetical protein [Isosphaeraceae bacterium]
MATEIVEDVAWSPPEGVTTHAGVPIDPEMDFFEPPPKEIGEVRTASSTLKVRQNPPSTAVRGAALFGPAALAIVILHYVANLTEPIFDIIAFLACFGLGWYFTRFSHTCSYVGKDGVARIRCARQRYRIAKREVFLFRDAQELRTSQTRHYHNGIYTHTAYNFTWSGPAGKVFKLEGTYRGEKQPPKPKDPFHFAQAGEVAWSLAVLDRAQAELERDGAIKFRLTGTDWVALGPGFIDLNLKGQTQRCNAEEVDGVSIAGGVFKVKRKDAKEGWFRSEGVFQFAYGNMANARVFLLALDKLLGLRFG